MQPGPESFELSKELDDHGWDVPGYMPPSYTGVIATTESFEDEFQRLADSIDIRLGNDQLPVFSHKDIIVETVRNNPVTIIAAETGAGKSTEIPQYLFEDGYDRVYLTQPRRTAARNIYSWIKQQISEKFGEPESDRLVSYQTAGEREGFDDARMNIVTDGLQLVRELHDKGFIEREVLLIDEAHEWNSNVEVLVAWVKKAITDNPELRVVIMSATMDTEHLADYYADVCQTRPPIIEIDGRKNKVEMTEAPESTAVDKVVEIIASITTESMTIPESGSDILVFEPGKKEIQDAITAIRRQIPKESANDIVIVPLHAKLSQAEQDAAIAPYPGRIKVVVSTDVAQTSLTIPGVKYVVDTGLHRRPEIDHEGTPGLKCVAISQADCHQRAGRTGRVADGFYYLTKPNQTTSFVTLADRERFPSPEILRTDIARNMLRLKAIGLDIRDFDMYHKAADHIIDLAEENLKLLGALDDNGRITAIGLEMDMYPACTSSGRIMVEAKRFHEKTRAHLAAIVAAKEAGGLQYFSGNPGKRWRELTKETSSDLLVQLDLFIAAQNMSPAERKEYDLDLDNFDRALEQYHKIAKLAGADRSQLEPPSEQVRQDIKDCIFAGYITSIYETAGEGEYVHAFKPWPTRRKVSNRSLVSAQSSSQFLIGDPYRIEAKKGGDDSQNLENVQEIDTARLGAIALGSIELVPENFVVRNGKGVRVMRKSLFGIDLGTTELQVTEPSPELRRAIIKHAIANPGSAQTELRAIKKELERLSHRSKDPVPLLTQDQLIKIIHEAAPEDITNPAQIEDNLRAMLYDPERRLSLNDYVTAEKRTLIENSSPDTIVIPTPNGDTRIHLTYREHKVIARRYNREKIINLEDEILLEDGRRVIFSEVGSSKKLTLRQLQAKIKKAQR